jgi:hypothetical protein
MTRKLNNITSLLLLLVFLLPSIIKLEHSHDHFECKSINEKNTHVLHHRCVICDFEFSVFLSNSENVGLEKENPLDNYFNNYNSRFYSNFTQLSFFLRAPPDKQI